MIEKENKKRANHGEFLQSGEPPLIGRARSSQKTSLLFVFTYSNHRCLFFSLTPIYIFSIFKHIFFSRVITLYTVKRKSAFFLLDIFLSFSLLLWCIFIFSFNLLLLLLVYIQSLNYIRYKSVLYILLVLYTAIKSVLL